MGSWFGVGRAVTVLHEVHIVLIVLIVLFVLRWHGNGRKRGVCTRVFIDGNYWMQICPTYFEPSSVSILVHRIIYAHCSKYIYQRILLKKSKLATSINS